jgi:hypothetical protein
VRPALTIAPPACASADRRTGAAPRLEDEGRPVRSQVDVASRVDVLVGLKRRAVGQLNLGKSTSEFVRSGWLEWLLGQRSIRAISSSLAVEGVKDLPVPHRRALAELSVDVGTRGRAGARRRWSDLPGRSAAIEQPPARCGSASAAVRDGPSGPRGAGRGPVHLSGVTRPEGPSFDPHTLAECRLRVNWTVASALPALARWTRTGAQPSCGHARRT